MLKFHCDGCEKSEQPIRYRLRRLKPWWLHPSLWFAPKWTQEEIDEIRAKAHKLAEELGFSIKLRHEPSRYFNLDTVQGNQHP